MISRIEQIISEIEDYIEGCKPQAFSNKNIIVNKEEIDELICELRLKIPDDVGRCRRIVADKERIILEAKKEADLLLEEALKKRNEIIEQANSQAQAIISNARHKN